MTIETIVEPLRRSPTAERLRLHRERKKNGMRCLLIELREAEIDALVRRGHLKPETRNDVGAITGALYAWFDSELN
jgi:hypothetical protein